MTVPDRTQADSMPGSSAMDFTVADDSPQVSTDTGIVPLQPVVPLAEAVDASGVLVLRLGVYRLVELLGEGGMGKVYRAVDEQLNRVVAVKVMRPEIAQSPQALERFLREARAAAAVKNDHIVTVYQVGYEQGVPFLAMEFLQGEVLETRAKCEQQLPIDDIVRIGRDVARGLAAAHAGGLIHRDIKLANVWLEPLPENGYRAKLLDFGLARGAENDAHITGDGQVVGTPAYMSPEQANGDPIDSRTDLFSLGVLLYRLATGVFPFRGNTAMAVLTALATQAPVSPKRLRPDLPQPLADLILQLLEKDRNRRPSTAAAVAARLTAASPTQTVIEVAPLPDELQHTNFDFELSESAGQPSLPTAETTPRVRTNSRRPRVLLPLIFILCGLILLAGVWKVGAIIVEVKTARGILVVETDDPNVEVIVKKDGATVRDRTRDREIELRVGDYTIELADKKDGLRLSTSGFTIERDGKAYVKVRLDKPRPEFAKKEPVPLPAVFVPAVDDGPSPLDALEPAKIPPGERFPWQPKELVAVVGSHRMKHWAPIQRVVYNPKGDLVASYGADGVRIWDVATLTEKAHLDYTAVENAQSLNFSPDGSRLTVYVQGHGTRLLDMTTLPPKTIATVAGVNRWNPFSPDGKRMVLDLEGIGKTAEVWDVSGTEPKWIARFSLEIPSVRMAMPTVDRVLTVSPYNPADNSKNLAILREVHGTSAKEIDRLKHTVPEYELSHDGRWFVLGTVEKQIKVYDLSGGKFEDKRSFKDEQIGDGGRPSQFFFVRGTDQLAYSAYGGPWTIRDLKTAKMLRPTTPPVASTVVGDYRPGGGGLISTVAESTQGLLSFDIDAEGKVTVAARSDTLVHALSAPWANRFISWEVNPQPPRRWDLDVPQPKSLPIKLAASTRALTLLPDGRVVGNLANTPKLVIIDPNRGDAATPTDIAELPNAANVLATSRTGRWLAAASAVDGARSPHLFDLFEAKRKALGTLKEYPARGAYIGWMDFSPSEQFLAAVGASYGVATEACVWDLRGPKPKFVQSLPGATSIQFALDQPTLVVGFVDGKVNTYDYSTGKLVEIASLQPLTRRVASALILPGGKTLLASDAEGTVQFVKLPTGKPEHPWTFPGWVIFNLAPDGRHLMTINANGTGYVLRLKEAEKVLASPLDQLDAKDIAPAERVPELPKDAVAVIGKHAAKHWGGVYALACSADGKLLATAGADGVVRLFDPIERKETETVTVLPPGHIRIALSRDGRTLAACGSNGANVWSIANGKLRKRLDIPVGGSDVMISPDGTKLALTWMHEHIKVFDISGPERHEMIKSLEGHVDSVWTPVFLKGSKLLATTGSDRTVRVWDLATGKQLHKFGPFGDIGGGLHAIRDGEALMFVMSDGMIRTWDFGGDKLKEQAFRLPIGGLTIHLPSLSSVTPDGKLLATRLDHNYAQIWNLADPGEKPLRQFESHSCIPALSADGKMLFLSNAAIASTEVIDLTHPKPERRSIVPGIERIVPIAFRPDSQILSYRVDDAVAQDMVFQAIGPRGFGEPVREPRVPLVGSDSLVAFGRGPTANRLYTVREQPELVEIDQTKPADAPPLRRLRVPPLIRYIHVSADGTTLAVLSGSGDTTKIVVLKPADNGFQEIARIENLPPLGDKIRLAADGSSVYGQEIHPSGHGSVRRWEVGTKEFKTIPMPGDLKTCALWDLSDDGRRLGMMHGNGVAVFDVSSPEPRLFGKTDGLAISGFQRFMLSPDGRQFVVGGHDGSVSPNEFRYAAHESSTGNRKKLWTFPFALGDIRFAPDGRYLLTQNGNGTGYVIRVQRGPLKP